MYRYFDVDRGRRRAASHAQFGRIASFAVWSLANLIDTLERRLHGDPQIVNVHLYDPLNVRAPPPSRRLDEVGLFLDIYFDGSHERPNFENGFAQLEAG